jgi:hypothetical protein
MQIKDHTYKEKLTLFSRELEGVGKRKSKAKERLY